jgi:hypothetical protein
MVRNSTVQCLTSSTCQAETHATQARNHVTPAGRDEIDKAFDAALTWCTIHHCSHTRYSITTVTFFCYNECSSAGNQMTDLTRKRNGLMEMLRLIAKLHSSSRLIIFMFFHYPRLQPCITISMKTSPFL